MSDFTKLPFEQILDQVNADNSGANILVDEVTFGNPEAGTVGGKNSDLVLTAKAHPTGRFIVGSTQTFHYNRQNLGAIISAGNDTFFRSDTLNDLASLRAAIAARFFLNAGHLGDFSYTDFPDEEDGPVTITVGNSLVFLAGTATVNIVSAVALSAFTPVTELNGLTYEPPAPDNEL